MGRRIGLRQPRRAGAACARRRDAGKLLDRAADVPGRLGHVARAPRCRSRWPTRPGASTWRARSPSSRTTCRWAPRPQEAGEHIRLLMLVNDVSLRNLIPAELAKGFGFFHGKPSTAFSPVAVTPDELGPAWRDGKVHLPLLASINGKPLGRPNAGIDMTFSFPAADRARRQDAPARRRQHHRLGHGLQQGRAAGRASRSSRAAPATPASPRCARWRRSWRASRGRRSWSSATACASRCWTRRPLDLRRHRPAGGAIHAMTPVPFSHERPQHEQQLRFHRRHGGEEHHLRRDRPRPLRLHGRRRPQQRHHRRRRRRHRRSTRRRRRRWPAR